MGAAAFADDLALMAPDRHSLQRMMKACEDYGKEHNLAFSTDPDPSKSKTKCVIFRGKKKIKYPAPIILDGKPFRDSKGISQQNCYSEFTSTILSHP